MDKRKVVLVGTGFVGMSFAYSLLNQGGADELVLIDVLKEKAEGEALDLSHGLPYTSSRMQIRAGDYSECADSDIVVIAAGRSQKPGETRLDLLKGNAVIIKEVTKEHCLILIFAIIGAGLVGCSQPFNGLIMAKAMIGLTSKYQTIRYDKGLKMGLYFYY